MNVSAIIAAAGSGSRMGTDKMLASLCGKPVILRTAEVISSIPRVDEVIIVASKNNIAEIRLILAAAQLEADVRVIEGGSTRGESSLRGIRSAKNERVLIHDGARPLVKAESIEKCIDDAEKFGAAALGVVPKDTVKKCENGFISETVPRSSAVLIQTPQIFRRSEILKAYESYDPSIDTDDCSVAERFGIHIRVSGGDYENIKLTTPDDMLRAEAIINRRNGGGCGMRIGSGYDSHRLTHGRKLIIGGVDIPFDKGLYGHSDADVLLHAIIDALFGACALGNIGSHFPDSDERYRGASSLALLKAANDILKSEGFSVSNIDATIIIQQPKMAPYIDEMRKNIAGTLGIDICRVSVKAKTNERMGFTGRGEGVEAHAVALVSKAD